MNAQVEVTTDQLVADLKTVVEDAEALLKATSTLTGEKIQEVRARAEESLRQAKVRLGEVEEEATAPRARDRRRRRRIRSRESLAVGRHRRRHRPGGRTVARPSLSAARVDFTMAVETHDPHVGWPRPGGRSAAGRRPVPVAQ